jgi:hypothetical protein
VDLIGEYITGKTLNPSVDSALSGRITDLTPQANGPALRPGKSLFVAPTMAAFDPIDTNKDKGRD